MFLWFSLGVSMASSLGFVVLEFVARFENFCGLV